MPKSREKISVERRVGKFKRTFFLIQVWPPYPSRLLICQYMHTGSFWHFFCFVFSLSLGFGTLFNRMYIVQWFCRSFWLKDTLFWNILFCENSRWLFIITNKHFRLFVPYRSRVLYGQDAIRFLQVVWMGGNTVSQGCIDRQQDRISP